MKMNTLLKQARLPQVQYNHIVQKICLNSKDCCKNSVFVAVDGNHLDATRFIEDAIAHGAKTIITNSLEFNHSGINFIYTENPRKTLAILAKNFYRDLSSKLKIIGVVGTNGKTTTSSIGYSFFNSIGKPSMLIGSNGIFFEDQKIQTNNTTPDILTIYEYLSLAKKKHIQVIFMEISSISVDQYRIYGIQFFTLIFTNFTQDHLDYHKTLEEYLYCKLIPFIKLSKNAYAIVNTDDKASSKFLKYCDAKIISYGSIEPSMFLATLNRISEDGISFYSKDILFETHLIGEFNMYNALAILALCDVFQIPYMSFKNFLKGFQAVSGRMNHICFQNKHIMLDYAHTFYATKRAIEEVQKLCRGKLLLVLGCGGNREKEKRFMIGKFLNEISAEIFLTTDNPRFEKPEAIIADIAKNLTKEVRIISDRRTAIEEALKKMQKEDYLLILGKGCENYMDIQGVKYPYSDLEVIHDWIRMH